MSLPKTSFSRYVLGEKPLMVVNEDYEPILWNESLKGGSERSEATPLTFEDLWEIQRPTLRKDMPRETWETTIGDINIKLPRTQGGVARSIIRCAAARALLRPCTRKSFVQMVNLGRHSCRCATTSGATSDNPGTCMDVAHLAGPVSAAQAFGALVEYRYNRA